MKIVEKLSSDLLKKIPLGESRTFKLPSKKAIYNAQKMCTWTRDNCPELGVKIFRTSKDGSNMTITIEAVPENSLS